MLPCSKKYSPGTGHEISNVPPPETVCCAAGGCFSKSELPARPAGRPCRNGTRIFSRCGPGALLWTWRTSTRPAKSELRTSIRKDFADAFEGIKKLPRSARFGVYVADVYYLALFRKIKNTPSHLVMRSRIRIPKPHKATLLAYSYVKHQLNWL